MVRKIAVFAVLAAVSIATPTNELLSERNLGKLFSVGSGWTPGAASALEACASGATSGSVSPSNKQELSQWCNTQGSSMFNAQVLSEVQNWCSGGNEVTISSGSASSIMNGFGQSQWGGSQCNLYGYLNNIIGGSNSAGTLVADSDLQSGLNEFLSSSEASGVDVNSLSAMKTCAGGGIAASLSSEAQTSFSSWLSSSKCSLQPQYKSGCQGWLKGQGGSWGKGCTVTATVPAVPQTTTCTTSPQISVTKTIPAPAPPPVTIQTSSTVVPVPVPPTPVPVTSPTCSCEKSTVVPPASPVTTSTALTFSPPAQSTTFSSVTASVSASVSVTPFQGASTQIKSYSLGALSLIALGNALAFFF